MRRMLVVIALAALAGACGSDKGGSDTNTGESKRGRLEHERSSHDLADIAVKRYAFELYPMWAAANPSKACPDSIADLNPYLDPKDAKQTNDPWGTPYQILCGPTAPTNAPRGLSAVSAGPDRKMGTDDDIASWN